MIFRHRKAAWAGSLLDNVLHSIATISGGKGLDHSQMKDVTQDNLMEAAMLKIYVNDTVQRQSNRESMLEALRRSPKHGPLLIGVNLPSWNTLVRFIGEGYQRKKVLY